MAIKNLVRTSNVIPDKNLGQESTIIFNKLTKNM